MVCEFTRNGISKKLNAASATPSNISKLFKVSLDSLMLIDESGNLIVADGNDAFSQSLQDGAVYQVEGDDMISVATAGASNSNNHHQVAVRPNMHVISSQDQLSEVVNSVSKSTKPIHDNVCLLYDGPNAVTVINSLAILAAATADPSLVSKIMGKDQFKYIKNPDSFRTALYQVSTSMCNAFRKADNSMGTIRACLIDMPDDIQEALAGVALGNDTKKLNRLIRHMEASSEECKNSAKEAKDTFNETLLELQELIRGATSAKSASETNFQDAEKMLQELEIKQKQQNEEIADAEARHQENIKMVQEAAENYKKASIPVDVGDLIGLTLIDMVKDGVHELASMPGKTASFVTRQAGKIPGLGEFISSDPEHKSNKLELDSVHLDEIEEILFDIQSTDDLTPDDISSWIERLEAIKGSSKIGDVMLKVKNLRLHLQTLRKDPKLIAPDKKVALLSKELSRLVKAAQQHLEKHNQQSAEREKARLSLAETMVKEHTKIQNNARDRLDKEEERKDKNLEAMRQSKKDLAELMAKMKNLDLTKVEMDGVILCLQEGLTYLSNVQKHWTNLANFFETLNIIVAKNLSKSIADFTEGIKDGDAIETLVKPALVASGMCVQICNCASVYHDVSQKFVMPAITTIAGNLSLSKEAARTKKNMLEMENGNNNEAVRQLIDATMKTLTDEFDDNLEKQQTKLLRAITH